MFTRSIVECGVRAALKSRGISYRQLRHFVQVKNTCACQPSSAKTCRTINMIKPSPSLYFVARHNSTESADGNGRSKKCKKEVHYEELVTLLQKEAVHVIDVREPKELEQTGKIHPKAVNLPLTKLKECLKSAERFLQECHIMVPNKKEDIVFYGYTDVKSVAALEIACKMGYINAKHYPGGWQEWSQKQQI